ncbi:MAG: hypothetical protein KZQ95_12410 [Candidatus Thiodiazotropha sp. (ex Epidulcina cf. delphinae)]|nr:hypothetical protein [Candidatus Thiodiazotropha sp. (ex Epidulcina cf. delphinae)]
MPLLGRHQYQPPDPYLGKYPFLTDGQILNILAAGKNHAAYPEIILWWEAKKAKLSVKKAIIAADSGVENIFFQFMRSINSSANPWSHSGLMSSGLPNQSHGPVGTLKAVSYALGQLNEKIGTFNSVINRNPISSGADPYNHVWIFEFATAGGKALIAWNDAGSTVDLSSHILTPQVSVTPIITELDADYKPVIPTAAINATDAIPLGDTPVFINKPNGSRQRPPQRSPRQQLLRHPFQ